jgi:hypothetical protein
MANPTSNFGWQMPTNTDLVKDLPADFEVFGQAVDTDLADLKGGTTGQVLSKTSGTDLDFTWVTPTDQTPLTTKGDLFGYSTADARIPVGSNGQVLTADSAETLGVKWATPGGNFSWTTYTPTLTQITLGNGGLEGRYVEITTGTIVFWLTLVIGSTTSFNSSFSEIGLPTAVKRRTEFLGHYWDDSTSTLRPFTSPVTANGNSSISLRALNTSATYAGYTSFSSGAPITWANSDYFIVTGVYEKN